MKEFSNTEINIADTPKTERFRKIKPTEEMSYKELNEAVKEEFSKAKNDNNESYDIPKEDGVDKPSSEEKNLDPSHRDCMSTTKERIDQAGYSKGKWDGEVGNSTFHPEDREAQRALKEFKQKGIEYKDGEPDFSKVSVATVRIDNMTSERYGKGYNFDQANHACAEKWNKEAKYGKTDWTARDVENWRNDNNYTWHERLDRKTMDLVQRDIHFESKHIGGVSECKRVEASMAFGGGFDE